MKFDKIEMTPREFDIFFWAYICGAEILTATVMILYGILGMVL
jgi:hypothetical protein